MTRTPAPADHPAMDLALREAAEQWRSVFEVPRMPLLDGNSQPIGAYVPARLHWTRPVLVAASIIALGAVAAIVISTARPADRVAGPSVSTAPTASGSPSTTSDSSTTPSSSSPSETSWPTTNSGDLVITEGPPPPTITMGGVVLKLKSTGSPSALVVDSAHPTFLSVAGRNDPSPCEYVTRVFLDRNDPDTVTVTGAMYSPEFRPGKWCDAMARSDRPLQGTAPYPIAGLTPVAPRTHAEMPHVDLADYPAPRWVSSGFTLGPTFSVEFASGSRSSVSRFDRRLSPVTGDPENGSIRLTWQNPGTGITSAAAPSVPTEVIRCATRTLRTDLAVTACSSSVDPRQPISQAELQRVVDSIPG